MGLCRASYFVTALAANCTVAQGLRHTKGLVPRTCAGYGAQRTPQYAVQMLPLIARLTAPEIPIGSIKNQCSIYTTGHLKHEAASEGNFSQFSHSALLCPLQA